MIKGTLLKSLAYILNDRVNVLFAELGIWLGFRLLVKNSSSKILAFWMDMANSVYFYHFINMWQKEASKELGGFSRQLGRHVINTAYENTISPKAVN